MTDDQVDLIVQHLSEHLHLALRLRGSEAHPPNAKDIGFEPAFVGTVLLTGLRSAGVTIQTRQPERAKSHRGPKRKTRDGSPNVSALFQPAAFTPARRAQRRALHRAEVELSDDSCRSPVLDG
jgi:hypothetical protein